MSDIIADAIKHNKPGAKAADHDVSDEPSITSISTRQAVINNTIKTAMYDIEKNNIGNPKEEFAAKAKALRNIGRAAIAGATA